MEKDKSQTRLKRKANYLLTKGKFVTRDETALSIISELRDIGRLALIGGAIRDANYKTSHSFKSDLDFVIETKNISKLEKFIERHKAKPNKFGGYRIQSKDIDIDFWDVYSSWAHKAGYRRVGCLEDVVNTTFFNLDAIIYLVDENKIEAKDGTLQDLENKFLDINLEPNPNPLGAATRALRRMAQYKLSASDRLIYFISKQIDEFGWVKILENEIKAYPKSIKICNFAGRHPENGKDFIKITSNEDNKLPLIEQMSLIY